MTDDATLTFTFVTICFAAGIGAFVGATTSEYREEAIGLVGCGIWLIAVGLWIAL